MARVSKYIQWCLNKRQAVSVVAFVLLNLLGINHQAMANAANPKETTGDNHSTIDANRNGAGSVSIKDNNKNSLAFFPMQIDYSQKDDKGGVVVNVVNASTNTYLLQGAVSAFDPVTGRSVVKGNKDIEPALPPFVVLPPLKRLNGEDRAAIRVRQIGGDLPQDRESAAVISVLAIPGSGIPEQDKKKDGGSQVQIALRMNMRLFWRPEGIPAPKMSDVASALTFSAEGNALKVVNPTPYYVHFSSLNVGGISAPDTALASWIPPRASQSFPLNHLAHGTVVWTLLGDTHERHTKL